MPEATELRWFPWFHCLIFFTILFLCRLLDINLGKLFTSLQYKMKISSIREKMDPHIEIQCIQPNQRDKWVRVRQSSWMVERKWWEEVLRLKKTVFFKTLLVKGRARVSPEINVASNTECWEQWEPQCEWGHILKTMLQKKTLKSSCSDSSGITVLSLPILLEGIPCSPRPRLHDQDLSGVPIASCCHLSQLLIVGREISVYPLPD